MTRLKNSILAIKVNKIKLGKTNKKKNNNYNQNCLGKITRNLNKIWYYNCNEKAHYLNNYIKSLKN